MNATSSPRTPLFPLGHVVSTPGAFAALAAEGMSGHDLLQRHQSGDWGELPEEDRTENRRALKAGLRIFSSYRLPNTQARLWIITEHDRSLTTLLLPQEY